MLHKRIYLDENDERVFIDTYIANEKGKARDAMLVIPGGGYAQVCTEREGEPIALAFLARGVNAFVLNYGVSRPTDVYPKQLIDAGRAMVYIREHAEEFSIDPERVFALGFSAGGHLCGTLATMHSRDEIKAVFEDKCALVRPTGVVLCYPVTVPYGNTHMSSFRYLLGKSDEQMTEEEKRYVSLEYAVSESTSPMYLWHTAEDTLVPLDGTLKVGMALKTHGIPFMLDIFPYGPHGVALSNEITESGNPAFVQSFPKVWVDKSITWMKTIR